MKNFDQPPLVMCTKLNEVYWNPINWVNRQFGDIDDLSKNNAAIGIQTRFNRDPFLTIHSKFVFEYHREPHWFLQKEMLPKHYEDAYDKII